MKIGKSSACIVAIILATVSVPYSAKAAPEFYKTFGFTLVAPTDMNSLSFALPVDSDPLAIGASVGITITNSQSSGLYGISPVAPSPDIEDVYLGTAADPDETLVASLGTAFSQMGGPLGSNDSVTESFEVAHSLVLPPVYTEITIVTDFIPMDLSAAGFTGSIDLEYMMIPEPSTWALFLGGLGAIGLLKLRQRKQKA